MVVAKIELQMSTYPLYWKASVSWSEAKGVLNDSLPAYVTWQYLCTSRCMMASLKSVSNVEALGQVIRPFEHEDWGCVLLCFLCGTLSVVACQELFF